MFRCFISQETCGDVNVVVCIILQIIALSASANKLSKIQERAEEYAALIMEELDPDNFGYIEVCILYIQIQNKFFKKKKKLTS